MEWIQFLILIITLGSFIWTIRSDMKGFEKDSKEWRERYDRETKEFRERWAQETKEFHGRLIAIEERRNKFIFKE